MANFAIITGNTVSNVIVADTLADAQAASPDYALVVEDPTNTVGITWVYDGNKFIAPVIAAPAIQGVNN